ncbi:MAG: hypothetical protein R3311_15130, partial [Oceanisphaera sp.]|nr:hypothetical protein [Oceanisphaera sp.]
EPGLPRQAVVVESVGGCAGCGTTAAQRSTAGTSRVDGNGWSFRRIPARAQMVRSNVVVWRSLFMRMTSMGPQPMVLK